GVRLDRRRTPLSDLSTRYEFLRPETYLAAVPVFGAVHGLVGVALEFGGVLTIHRIHGDTDASGNADSLAFERGRFLQSCNQRFSDRLCGRIAGAIFNDRQELVATDSG